MLSLSLSTIVFQKHLKTVCEKCVMPVHTYTASRSPQTHVEKGTFSVFVTYFCLVLPSRFTVNRRISIVGFGLYGSIHGPTDYQVNIQVRLPHLQPHDTLHPNEELGRDECSAVLSLGPDNGTCFSWLHLNSCL